MSLVEIVEQKDLGQVIDQTATTEHVEGADVLWSWEMSYHRMQLSWHAFRSAISQGLYKNPDIGTQIYVLSVSGAYIPFLPDEKIQSVIEKSTQSKYPDLRCHVSLLQALEDEFMQELVADTNDARLAYQTVLDLGKKAYDMSIQSFDDAVLAVSKDTKGYVFQHGITESTIVLDPEDILYNLFSWGRLAMRRSDPCVVFSEGHDNMCVLHIGQVSDNPWRQIIAMKQGIAQLRHAIPPHITHAYGVSHLINTDSLPYIQTFLRKQFSLKDDDIETVLELKLEDVLLQRRNEERNVHRIAERELLEGLYGNICLSQSNADYFFRNMTPTPVGYICFPIKNL